MMKMIEEEKLINVVGGTSVTIDEKRLIGVAVVVVTHPTKV